jgi:predicted O-methyltransferase YrrM
MQASLTRLFSCLTARPARLRRLHPDIYRIFTHLTMNEKELLYRLAAMIPGCPAVVEIGSYLGASTCFLAAGVSARKGKVYAVDTWTNIAMTEGPRDTFEEFLRHTRSFGEHIVIMRGKSEDVGQSFPGPVDLLFIDGDHSYEGVSADIRTWLPRVKDGGTMVLHDYAWAEGVQRAVREFIAPLQREKGHVVENTYWTTIHGGWQSA